jgi:hypothetical protein
VGSLGIGVCPPPHDDEKVRAIDAVNHSGPAPKPPRGGPIRVLVVGDSLGCSVAIGLAPAGEPALVAHQATIIGCGIVSDQVYDDEEPFPRGTENCPGLVARLEGDALAVVRPDLVLWVSTWERFNFVEGNELLPTGSPAWKQSLQRRLESGYARLTADGARLAFVTVAPPAPASMINGGRIVSPRFDWRFAAMNQQLRRFVTTHPDTRLIDVAAKVCPLGSPCPATVGGVDARHGDGVHFDPPGSVWLSRWMLPQLLAAASAPRPPPTTAPPLPAVP